MKKIILPLFLLIITLSLFICGSALAADTIQDTPTKTTSSQSGFAILGAIILVGILGIFSVVLFCFRDADLLWILLLCGVFMLIFAVAACIFLG